MEPPADPADPADPAEARAKQPDKWALVRSLNHVLKSYAVLPVRPARGGGGRTPGSPPRASVSLPGGNWGVMVAERRGARGQGTQVGRTIPDSQRELGPRRPPLCMELLRSPKVDGPGPRRGFPTSPGSRAWRASR